MACPRCEWSYGVMPHTYIFTSSPAGANSSSRRLIVLYSLTPPPPCRCGEDRTTLIVCHPEQPQRSLVERRIFAKPVLSEVEGGSGVGQTPERRSFSYSWRWWN